MWAEGSRKDVSENTEVCHTKSGFGESSMKGTQEGGLRELSLAAEQLENG